MAARMTVNHKVLVQVQLGSHKIILELCVFGVETLGIVYISWQNQGFHHPKNQDRERDDHLRNDTKHYQPQKVSDVSCEFLQPT